MKKLWSALLACLWLSCAQAATLNVAVAANMQYPFEELSRAFTRATGIAVNASYNSSGKFATQIINGAPYDVFLSADTEFVQKLAERGLTVTPPRVYARGSLVVWSTRPGLDLAHWRRALASPQVTRIAVANPQTAPYGRETLRVLAHYRLDGALKSKIVYGDSISQTNQYIESGSVDVGFTARSVVLSPQMKGRGHWVDVDPAVYSPIAQAMAPIRRAGAPAAEAQRLCDFMLGAEARTILARYGYLAP